MSKDILLTRIQKRGTIYQNAWKNGQYETYRLNFAIPAVRLRGPAPQPLIWFAVDEYNLSVMNYHHRYSLPKKLDDVVQETWLLSPGSLVNVGVAADLFSHPGGGLQFELLPGSRQPALIEQKSNPKRVQY
jgi:hypothetical protein